MLSALVLAGLGSSGSLDGRACGGASQALEARGVRRRSAAGRRMPSAMRRQASAGAGPAAPAPAAALSFAALRRIFLTSRCPASIREAIPSALIGKPAPDFDLPPWTRRSHGMPCRAEPRRPQGQADAGQRLRLVVRPLPAGASAPASASPATAASARRHQLQGPAGQCRAASSATWAIRSRPSASIREGRAAIDWGVYGVPETFLVGPDGAILYKFIGPITEDALNRVVRPEIDKVLGDD